MDIATLEELSPREARVIVSVVDNGLWTLRRHTEPYTDLPRNTAGAMVTADFHEIIAIYKI